MFKTYLLMLLCVFVLGCDARPCTGQSRRTDKTTGGRPAAAAPQRWALLVGIENYSALPALKSARGRVETLKETLLAGGFPKDQVVALCDDAVDPRFQPLGVCIRREWEMASRCAAPEDLAIFAVTGRGIRDGGKTYLCPIESQAGGMCDAISLDALVEMVAVCPARQKILLLELFDAAPSRSANGGEGNADPSMGIKNLAAAKELIAFVRWHAEDITDDLLFPRFTDALAGEADVLREGGRSNGDGFVSLNELIDLLQTSRENRAAWISREPEGVDFRVGRISKVGKADMELARKSLERAHVLAAQGKLDEAFSEYTHSIELDQFQMAAYRYRGSLSWRRKDFQRALDDYRRIGKSFILVLPCPTAELRNEGRITATLRQGQQLEVTEYREGYLWINGVDGDINERGWIQEHVFFQSNSSGGFHSR